MKKILFVLNTLRIGGAEKSLVSLLNALDYRKYQVDLLLFEDDGPLKKELPEEVNVIYGGDKTRAMILEFRYYGKSLLKQGHISAYISRLSVSLNKKNQKRKFSWNVIKKHIPVLKDHYDTAVSYLEGYPAYYVIDKVDADRKIAWIHTDFSKKDVLKEEIGYYSKMDRLVTISDQCMAALNQIIPDMKQKTEVIENLSDPAKIRSKAEEEAEFKSWKKDCTHIVTVGRLTEAKGIDQAIEAFCILHKKYTNLQWHVYGDGELRTSYETMIAEKGIGADFILEGAADNPYPFMKHADLVVQTSKWEGKSVVLDEAKILGKAIIVTDYPSAKDQIKDGINGLIAKMSPEGIADKIEFLLNNKELKELLEQNCRNEESSYSAMVERIANLLDNKAVDRKR